MRHCPTASVCMTHVTRFRVISLTRARKSVNRNYPSYASCSVAVSGIVIGSGLTQGQTVEAAAGHLASWDEAAGLSDFARSALRSQYILRCSRTTTSRRRTGRLNWSTSKARAGSTPRSMRTSRPRPRGRPQSHLGTAVGGCNPCACHSRQPSIIHASMPGHSCLQLFSQVAGRAARGGMVTVNGSRWNRRRIASSTDRRPGLWLPAMTSLNCGENSK